MTTARVQILSMLLAEGAALTHQQVEARVNKAYGIDRVTIYRVLEWLVRNGLAHRIATGERAWRFDAVDPDHAHEHAHFQCNRCGSVVCLDDVEAKPRVKLPKGFRSQEVELTVKGVCATCGPAGKAGRTAHGAARRGT
ncbi:MAG: transcriptional repressor [Burkholderiales bacterium]|nr:transcriptional repressor [Burkholderiales bacterium]